jgi:hypothetical protein
MNYVLTGFNSILSSMPVSYKWYLPQGFHIKTLYEFLFAFMCSICPAHLIFLYFVALNICQFSNAIHVLAAEGETKFHTHMKQQIHSS